MEETVTAYWVPATGEGYLATDWAEPTVVDLLCHACPGDHPPRLGRFAQDVPDGPIGVRPFRAEGELQGPAFWVSRSDGQLRWRLACPAGHCPNVRATDLARLLASRRAGILPTSRVGIR